MRLRRTVKAEDALSYYVRCRFFLRAAPQRSAIRRPAGVIRARFRPVRCLSRHAAQHLNFTRVYVHHAVAVAGRRVDPEGGLLRVPPNACTEVGAVMSLTIISTNSHKCPVRSSRSHLTHAVVTPDKLTDCDHIPRCRSR